MQRVEDVSRPGWATLAKKLDRWNDAELLAYVKEQLGTVRFHHLLKHVDDSPGGWLPFSVVVGRRPSQGPRVEPFSILIVARRNKKVGIRTRDVPVADVVDRGELTTIDAHLDGTGLPRLSALKQLRAEICKAKGLTPDEVGQWSCKQLACYLNPQRRQRRTDKKTDTLKKSLPRNPHILRLAKDMKSKHGNREFPTKLEVARDYVSRYFSHLSDTDQLSEANSLLRSLRRYPDLLAADK